MQQIATGDARIIVAGGQESMSLAPHCQQLRATAKMGPITLADSMGITAENVARQFGIDRAAQGSFALASQRKAAAAHVAGRFEAEIAPVTVKTRKGEVVVDADEYISADTSAEALGKLRPAFDQNGTVTAGNCLRCQ